jgi:hypothetical protein
MAVRVAQGVKLEYPCDVPSGGPDTGNLQQRILT